jgi:hypothetical protein
MVELSIGDQIGETRRFAGRSAGPRLARVSTAQRTYSRSLDGATNGYNNQFAAQSTLRPSAAQASTPLTKHPTKHPSGRATPLLPTPVVDDVNLLYWGLGDFGIDVKPPSGSTRKPRPVTLPPEIDRN